MFPLRLFESIRLLDGRLERLAWHQARAEYSVGHPLPSLETVLSALPLPEEGEYLLHLPYTARGYLPGQLRVVRYEPRRIRSLLVVESSLRYPLKAEDRRGFDRLKAAHPGADELILAQGGLVTDTTYSNLIFGEPGNWYTPHSYLLPGTRRASLLASGVVQERRIRIQDIAAYPYVSLINAMLPPGRLMLPTSAVHREG